jgi:exosortase
MATVSAVQKTTPAAPAEPRLSMSLIAVAIVCCLALAPLLFAHMKQLWVRPHYQFFPLVLIGAGVLLWSRRAAFKDMEAGSTKITIGLLAFAWLLLAGAEVLNSSWLAAVTMLVLLLTVIQIVGLVRPLFVVWVYLWILIPPPFGLDNKLIMSLQTLTTNWSSALLDLLRVQHVIAGHIMEVGGKRLFVEEACAGINSLFSILACALFYVFLMRIHFVRATLLLIASIGWVLVANMARVFIIAFASTRWEINLVDGWKHDVLGYVLFGSALVLIVSTHRLLLFFTPFANKKETVGDSPEASPQPVMEVEVPTWAALLNQSTLNSWIVGAAFGSLLVLHLGFYGLPREFILSKDYAYDNMQKITEDTMPRELGGWKRERWTEEKRSLSNEFGESSKSWFYPSDNHRAVVSVDYPFSGWHELSQCYYGQGWELDELTNLTGEEPEQPAYYCEQKMKKAGLRWGYLLFCQLDSTGKALTPPKRGFITGNLSRNESLLTWLIARNNPERAVVQPVGSVYQFQLFVESFQPLTVAEQEKMRTRFGQAYKALHGPLFNH